MSVTIFRLRDGEKSVQKTINPWDNADLKQYLHFCCPQCDFKSRQDFIFRHHMKENHCQNISKIKLKIDPQALINKFLMENKEKEHLDLNLPNPNSIDVIKNPPLQLMMPTFLKIENNPPPPSSENPSAPSSVSIFKVNKEIENEYFEQEEEEDFKMMDKDSKKCQDCSIVFLTSFRLQRHIKKFHGGVTPTMANSETPISDDSKVAEMPRPYSCQLCQKSFTSHAYLSSHIRKAHEKRFRCDQCGKSYGGSSYLREHIEAVHKKTKNYTCESCAASFYSKTQLTNHCLRNHSQAGDEKPCLECRKIFTNDLSLKLHMRNVHQPVKSMCSQCGKEYPNEVSLKKHVQCVHEKKRPYQCHICSKMFGSKWYVQQHVSKMHDHHQESSRIFKCNQCTFEFNTLRERNAHILKIHGTESTEAASVPVMSAVAQAEQHVPDLMMHQDLLMENISEML